MRASRPFVDIGEVESTVIAYADTPSAPATIGAGASFTLATTDVFHTDEFGTGPDRELGIDDEPGVDDALDVDGDEVPASGRVAPAPAVAPHEHRAKARTRPPKPAFHRRPPTLITLRQNRCTPETTPKTARTFLETAPVARDDRTPRPCAATGWRSSTPTGADRGSGP